MSEKKHSRFSPSAAAIWSKCAGYVTLAARYDKPSSGKANEGTAAHYVADVALRTSNVPHAGDKTPDGTIITPEMVRGAELYRDTIRSECPKILAAETEVMLQITDVHPDCFGTCDAYVVTDGVLYVYDYKFGWGIVEPKHNLQLILYAVGALRRLCNEYQGIHTVQVGIIQPRPWHANGKYRMYRYTVAELAAWVTQLKLAAAQAEQPAHVCSTGTHCEWCHCKRGCEAFRRRANELLDIPHVDAIVEQNVQIDDLGAELIALKSSEMYIKNRVAIVEAEMIAKIKNGSASKEWALVNGAGRLEWTATEAELATLEQMTGVPIFAKTPITPTQAGKAGLDPAWLTLYSKKQPTTRLERVNYEEYFKNE